MKKVFIIRHAESESNAGLHIEDTHIARLTETGKKQAEDLVEILDKPDRVIVSKYIRTQLTAFPLLQKYSDTEVHFWLDIHEFEPHDKDKSKEVPEDLKEKFYLSYWEKNDPLYRTTENSENFKEALDRVLKSINKLKNIPDGINYVFSHGIIIKIFLFIQDNLNLFKNKNELDYKEIMSEFLKFNLSFKTKNTGVYDITNLVNDF
jgi:broad specificity phosphatase PhoE